MEEYGMRAKSFRDEDYNTRRVFLRSYPLHFGDDESEAEETKAEAETANKSRGANKYKKGEDATTKVTNRTIGKKPIKKIILAFVHWGEERVLIFRRYKHNITIYVVNCVPIALKAPTGMISVKRM